VTQKTLIEGVREALMEEMERDERVWVLGEDVGRKGGVFLATEGLYDRYGEARVLWTRGRTFALQSPPDWRAAVADFENAVRLFEEMEERPALARALYDRAKALRALGSTAEAVEVEQRALTLGRELGLKDAPFD